MSFMDIRASQSDANIKKGFTLAQCIVQYLVYCQGGIEEKEKDLEGLVAALEKDVRKLKSRESLTTQKCKTMRKENRWAAASLRHSRFDDDDVAGQGVGAEAK